MKKRGHLLVTNHVASGQGIRKAGILLGCILPDFWIPSLLKGHTSEAAWERIKGEMTELEEYGSGNFLDSVRLGVVLHYVEDFFTYPHNKTYNGDFWGHVRYERKQYENFTQHLGVEKGVIEQVGYHPKEYVNSIQILLEEMLDEYDEMLDDYGDRIEDYEEMDTYLEADYIYMKKAAYMTVWHFERAFIINRISRKQKYGFSGLKHFRQKSL